MAAEYTPSRHRLRAHPAAGQLIRRSDGENASAETLGSFGKSSSRSGESSKLAPTRNGPKSSRIPPLQGAVILRSWSPMRSTQSKDPRLPLGIAHRFTSELATKHPELCQQW